jgi:hypothetical protein
MWLLQMATGAGDLFPGDDVLASRLYITRSLDGQFREAVSAGSLHIIPDIRCFLIWFILRLFLSEVASAEDTGILQK